MIISGRLIHISVVAPQFPVAPVSPEPYVTLSQSFTLVDTMARFHLKGEARQYFLGYFWWILEPLLYVAVFYIVFEKLLQNRQPDFLYFLIVGKLSFIWFSKSVNQASNSLVMNKGLIAQVYLRKELLPMAVIHQGFYRQVVVFAFLLILLLVGGYASSSVWLWLVPIALIQALLVAGCGMLAALLVCLHRDFRFVVQMGTLFLLFISGVFWDINAIVDETARQWLLLLNPLAALIDAYRQVLMLGAQPNLSILSWALFESVVLMGLAIWLYGRLQFWIARNVVAR